MNQPRLPMPLVPDALARRTLARALRPELPENRWLDIGLAIFCSGHLAWFLRAIHAL